MLRGRVWWFVSVGTFAASSKIFARTIDRCQHAVEHAIGKALD